MKNYNIINICVRDGFKITQLTYQSMQHVKIRLFHEWPLANRGAGEVVISFPINVSKRLAAFLPARKPGTIRYLSSRNVHRP
jgi:hypothetical protein